MSLKLNGKYVQKFVNEDEMSRQAKEHFDHA